MKNNLRVSLSLRLGFCGTVALVFTLGFPDAKNAFSSSVALNKLTGIAFTTSPVVDVEMFDRLITKAKDI